MFINKNSLLQTMIKQNFGDVSTKELEEIIAVAGNKIKQVILNRAKDIKKWPELNCVLAKGINLGDYDSQLRTGIPIIAYGEEICFSDDDRSDTKCVVLKNYDVHTEIPIHIDFFLVLQKDALYRFPATLKERKWFGEVTGSKVVPFWDHRREEATPLQYLNYAKQTLEAIEKNVCD